MLAKESSKAVVRFGDYIADLHCGELRRDGVKIKLQIQPFELLAMLLARPGELVTREELRQALWPSDTFVDFEHGLNKAINKLRDALHDDPHAPRYVETVIRRGYRFIATVEAELSQPVPAPTPLTASPDLHATATEVPLASHRREVRWQLVAALIVVGLLLCAIAVWQRKSGSSSQIRSIAVLPLRNLSNDPQQAYFADGMTEELITQLANIKALRVTSGTSVTRYKNSSATVPEIARQLGVDAVVEGTVLRDGDRVRVTAQLIEASTDKHLWAEEYDGQLRDVLSLQKNIAQAIVREIDIRISPEELRALNKRASVDPQAHDAYLKGRYIWHQRRPGSTVEFEQSRKYFESAIALDPSYSLGFSGLADFYGASLAYGLVPSAEGCPRARASAMKALELDPTIAETHNSVAGIKLYCDWDYEGAERELQTAFQVNDAYSEAHSLYATLLALRGRSDESIQQAKRAEELDPMAQRGRVIYALLRARRYPEVVSRAKSLLVLDPLLAHMYLELAYRAQHDDKRELQELLQEFQLTGEHAPAALLADHNKFLLFDFKEKSKHRFVPQYAFAVMYAYVGDKQHALAALEKALEEHDAQLVNIGIEPAFDPLRSDPAFRKIASAVGVAPALMNR